MFREAVSVQDPLTGEVFAVNWVLERNSETAPWLGTKYSAENIHVPLMSFLAWAVTGYWQGVMEPRTAFSYPIIVTVHDKPNMFCCLTRPINFSIGNGSFLELAANIEDIIPTAYCELVEDWQEIYNKYLEEKINEQKNKTSTMGKISQNETR